MNSQKQAFPVNRFILFIVLSSLLFFAWNTIFPPNQNLSSKATGSGAVETVPTKEKADSLAANESASSGTTDPDTNQPSAQVAKPAKIYPIREDRLLVNGTNLILSSKGAKLVSATVKEPERFQKEGDLLGSIPKDSPHYPFSIELTGGIASIPADYVFEVVEEESKKTENGYLSIVYRFTDPMGRFLVDKVYESDNEELYQYRLTVRIKNLTAPGTPPIRETLSLNIFGYHDPSVKTSFLETRTDSVEGVCKLQDDLERTTIDKLDDPDVYNESTIWGSVDRRYFLFSAIPENPASRCTIEAIDTDYLRTQLQQEEITVNGGETINVSWSMFTGPKDFDVLTEVGYDLRESVDFGMLSFIARPLRWLLVNIQSIVSNWGLAIIILTIIIRLILWPLNQMAYSQTEKMRRIQPQINEIKEKYKGDPQKIQEEQFRIMRESGTTPLGCLPMFLQFPILLALYFMILNSVELYHADFILWYTNLSAKDPYFVLPILMGIAMFFQQKVMTPPTDLEADPTNPAVQMQKMMKYMPFIFTAFMLFLPSGVVLYYLVSLIIGLGQQFYIRESIRKKYDRLDAAAANASSVETIVIENATTKKPKRKK